MSSDHTRFDPLRDRDAEGPATVGQLAWLTENPAAAADALAALAEEPVPRAERKKLKQLADALRAGAEEGSADGRRQLADRLASHQFAWLPPGLPEASIASSSAAPPEQPNLEAGALGRADMLARVVGAMHQQPHAPWRLVLIYPLMLLGLGVLVLIMLSMVVVPPFEAMFDEFGLDLPAPTLLLLSIARLLSTGPVLWLALALVLTGVAAAFIFARRCWFRRFGYFGLRPAGATPELRAMARFVRSLAESIQAGLPLQTAIGVAAERCGHPRYAQASAYLPTPPARDSPFGHRPETACFPANLLLAIRGAGRSGDDPNVSLLVTLAEMYEERAARRAEASAAMFGIAAVLVVALLVGFVALALLMPLVSLITGLT